MENKPDGVSRKYIPPARWAEKVHFQISTDYSLCSFRLKCLYKFFVLCKDDWILLKYLIFLGWCQQRAPTVSLWLEMHLTVAPWKTLAADWRWYLLTQRYTFIFLFLILITYEYFVGWLFYPFIYQMFSSVSRWVQICSIFGFLCSF